MSNKAAKVSWREQTVVERVWYLPVLVLFPLAIWGRDTYLPGVSDNFFLRIPIGIVMFAIILVVLRMLVRLPERDDQGRLVDPATPSDLSGPGA